MASDQAHLLGTPYMAQLHRVSVKYIMRAKEFIAEEDSFTDSAKDAMPNPTIWPDLDNSNPYHSYRFGVAIARDPDKGASFLPNGPVGPKMITVAFTPEEQEILARTGRQMGVKSKRIANPPSQETSDVNKSSPVPQNSGKSNKSRS
jgi:hypothetical protein